MAAVSCWNDALNPDVNACGDIPCLDGGYCWAGRPGRTRPEGASRLIAANHASDIGVAAPAFPPRPSWVCEDHPDQPECHLVDGEPCGGAAMPADDLGSDEKPAITEWDELYASTDDPN